MGQSGGLVHSNVPPEISLDISLSLNKSFDPRSHSLISKKRREVSNQNVHMRLGAILDFARGSLQDNPNIGDRLRI